MISPTRLDAYCSPNFRFRDLIQCGETWAVLASACGSAESRDALNLPIQAQSWSALADLSVGVLEPIIEHWGRPLLTYGFAGPTLIRAIRRRIAPRLDQHAAHEIGVRGRAICLRGGAAVDLTVPGVSSLRVAMWLAQRVAIDRLYVYSSHRPLHVSFGPDRARIIVHVLQTATGTPLSPRRLTLDSLKRLVEKE